jgi:predicted CXXCH cytochrome family protein
VDNTDGTYVYTFAKNVKAGPTAAGTSWDPNAVHRLVILMYASGNPFQPVNVVKEYVPASGQDVTGQNDKVDPAACLECHSNFRAQAGGTGAFHSGQRYDIRVCATCHNDQKRFTAIPGTGSTPNAGDAAIAANGTWTGNLAIVNGEAFVNFPVFIHKIHRGEELTLKGGTYVGFSQPYEVTYPQDVRNCTKCHRAPAAKAGNWSAQPSRRVCNSCHDDVSFVSPAPNGRTLHAGGALADDSYCTVCHPATGTANSVIKPVAAMHVAVASPDPTNSWAGGTNANTNAAYIAAAGAVPPGATPITWQVVSVSRNATKNPVITFKFMNGKNPVTFNTCGASSSSYELMSNFVGSPSVYFAWAVPQDGINQPADFNASASAYVKDVCNKGPAGTSGVISAQGADGSYTVTLSGQTSGTATSGYLSDGTQCGDGSTGKPAVCACTGTNPCNPVIVPDGAKMLTGGVGYTYSLSSAQPLTETDLPSYPYNLDGKKQGGLIVAAPDVWAIATGYTARRTIVSNDKCNACHSQLGANPTFHAGQRNDAPTCQFCHNPNRASGGWVIDSSTFIHGIHGGSKRTIPFGWFAEATAVTYPGILNNCEQCHVSGSYDFSASASAAAVPNLLWSTGASGNVTASTSPYVSLANYGAGFSIVNATGVSTQAASSTLVNSPIASACFSCHDTATDKAHMVANGGALYEARLTALAKVEQCLICHGPGTVAPIADVHK